MARIELDRVCLTFQVRQQGRMTFKEFLLRQKFRRSVNPVLEVEALRNLTFTVEEGERLGIVGHNGAGKSTLLKLLAGVYAPTSGRRRVDGQISSLFDIALGFEPEASGWQNIRYRGYLQGETPQSIQPKMNSIAEFSELGRFLDIPVRYYSAGMMVRLAFSIATAIDPEILLVDEVLSVGDLAFQLKARQRMKAMIARARLLVMVSHDLGSLGQLCTRGLWLDRGRLRLVGPIDEVISAYSDSVRAVATFGSQPLPANGNGERAPGNGPGANGNGQAGPNGQASSGKTRLVNLLAGPKDLRYFERRVYSQFGEDGILEEILKRIGIVHRFFVEFTFEYTIAFNCAHLALEQDWRGVFVDPNPDRQDPLALRFGRHPTVTCVPRPVNAQSVEALLAAHEVPEDFDVLSVATVGNDYWLWAALEKWRPRIVAIMYNASHPPGQRWVMPENPTYRWNGTTYFGASLTSLTRLGREKGYTLVGTNSQGVHAFFVRDDLVHPEKFLECDVSYHFSPAGYGPCQGNHPPGDGPFLEL